VKHGTEKSVQPFQGHELLPSVRPIVMSGDTPPPGEDAGITAHGGAKFAIGLLAGVTAVLLPRLLALLSKSDEGQLVFFPFSYYVLAAGVGLFLGLVMMVFEYRVAATPKQTFMAALGVPAVLSGALSTASTAESVSEVMAEAKRLRQAVSIEQGIVKDGAIGDFEHIGGPGSVAPPQRKPTAKTSALPLFFVPAAHAQENRVAQADASDPIRFGVRVEQPKYLVVLKRASSEEQAIQEASKLKAELPGARPVKAGNNYLVVLGNAPANETDALLAAARAKKDAVVNAVNPVLVEVKR